MRLRWGVDRGSTRGTECAWQEAWCFCLDILLEVAKLQRVCPYSVIQASVVCLASHDLCSSHELLLMLMLLLSGCWQQLQLRQQQLLSSGTLELMYGFVAACVYVCVCAYVCTTC